MSRLCCHTIDYERGTWMVPLSYNLSISVRAMTWGFQLPIQVLIKKKEKEQTFATCGYYSFPDPSQFENSLIKLVYLSQVTTIIRRKKKKKKPQYTIDISLIMCQQFIALTHLALEQQHSTVVLDQRNYPYPVNLIHCKPFVLTSI